MAAAIDGGALINEPKMEVDLNLGSGAAEDGAATLGLSASAEEEAAFSESRGFAVRPREENMDLISVAMLSRARHPRGAVWASLEEEGLEDRGKT